MAARSSSFPIVLLVASSTVFMILDIRVVSAQQLGSPDNSQIYDGPYIQVYPPVDLSQDQQNCSTASGGTCPLFIGLIESFGGDYDSSGAVPGVQIALDQINADPSMLPGYTLHYTLTDSNCSRVTSLEALTTQLFNLPIKIGIIGSGCSVATEPTAEVSRFYNLTQISHISSSPELSNRDRFRYYFQLLASDVNLAYGFYGIIRQFEWTRVSIIVQDENLFTAAMAQLRSLLSASNIDATERRFRSDENITTALGDNPFEPEYRVVVLSMYLPRARQILCKAYELGVRYPQYLFLVYPYYSIFPRWWEGTEEEEAELFENFGGCNATQRESVLPFSLGPIIDEFISDKSRVADSGINGSQFLSLYDSYLEQSPLNLTSNIASQQSYDATWTLARALDRVIKDIGANTSLQRELMRYNSALSSSGGFGLQHFTYNNSGVLRRIFSYLEQSDFAGITGPVTFDSVDGVRRVGLANIFSHQYVQEGNVMRLEAIMVGRVNFTDRNNVQFSFVEGYNEEMIWSTAGRPYDGVPNIKTVTVHVALTVIFFLLAIAGITFTIVCLVFNFIFRKKKIIRPSSPNLSNLIGIGAIVLYIDVFFFVIPTTNPTAIAAFCNLNPWFTAIGYSLCYGTILVKMFRVYYIINYPSPTQKNVIRDWMLALGVLLLVVIDLIILITYTAVEGARGNLAAQRVPNRENPEDMVGERAVIFRYFIYICDSQARDITLGILYGYKALLQLIALILAFSIRKVKFKVLNDSPYIALAIYVTSIVTAVILVSTYSLKDIVNGYAVVFGLGFLIGTTVILLLVFVPNMINLYQDPEGEHIRKMTLEQSPATTATTLRTQHEGATVSAIASKKQGIGDPVRPLLTGSQAIQGDTTGSGSNTTTTNNQVVIPEFPMPNLPDYHDPNVYGF